MLTRSRQSLVQDLVHAPLLRVSCESQATEATRRRLAMAPLTQPTARHLVGIVSQRRTGDALSPGRPPARAQARRFAGAGRWDTPSGVRGCGSAGVRCMSAVDSASDVEMRKNTALYREAGADIGAPPGSSLTAAEWHCSGSLVPAKFSPHRCRRCLREGCPRVWKAVTKADPRRTQDWFLKCLQGGRVHPLAVFGLATL
jgi:hypothetical protein